MQWPEAKQQCCRLWGIFPCSLHVAELQRFLFFHLIGLVTNRGIVFCTSEHSIGHTIYIFSASHQHIPFFHASWVSRCSWTSQWDLCHSPAASFLTPDAPCGPSATWCRGWAGGPGTRGAAGPTFSSDPERSKQRGKLADVHVWSAFIWLTSGFVCLLTFRTDFRFSIDTCVMAACSLCSFRKLLYSSRAFCSSSMRFCKYMGSFPKCCKAQEEMFTSFHIKIGRLTFLNVSFPMKEEKITFFLAYLGTSPEFSRSCLSPLIEFTLAGCGFMGSVVTVLMKFLLVTTPISGGAVFSGTGGFLSVQERLAFVESSFPGIDKNLTAIKTSACTSHQSADKLTVGEFRLFGTLL